MIVIDHLDHLVLTVADIEATCRFYETVMGFTRQTFKGDRTALHFGEQKFNLHKVGQEVIPNATVPTAGSADLCFIATTPLDEVIAHLLAMNVAIEVGPVERTGATGPILSVYFRDPDGNLIEVSNPI